MGENNKDAGDYRILDGAWHLVTWITRSLDEEAILQLLDHERIGGLPFSEHISISAATATIPATVTTPRMIIARISCIGSAMSPPSTTVI